MAECIGSGLEATLSTTVSSAKPQPSGTLGEARELAVFAGSIVAMLIGMGASVYYVCEPGESFDLAAFVRLWLRELLMLAVALVGALMIAGAWLHKLILRML